MTLPIERARSRRPITWLTIIGVLLLPAIIGGILVAALYNPVDRLDRMSAAIVNEDAPVMIGDTQVPLGRQLTAGLVKGSPDQASNLDWTISNAEDAAAGLADGTYAAVVTIPEQFSAAATSTRDGATAKAATIGVKTAPDALLVDDAITSTITQTAASVFGQALSRTYLENVFVGFTTLGTKLGEAADGATTLADGAASAADGAAKLPGGAAQLASGADGLSTGAKSLSSGLLTIGSGVRDSGKGAAALAQGLRGGAAQITADGLIPQQILDYSTSAATSSAATAQTLGTLAATCATSGASEQFCQDLGAAAQQAGSTAQSAGYAAGGLQQLKTQLPAGIAKQFTDIAAQVDPLAAGLGQLATGIDQSAQGATKLSSGATSLSAGATDLSNGAQTLAGGISELASGTDDLASGLHTASDSVPSYSEQEATNLASVVSDPVKAEGIGMSLFGASAIPLLAVLVLWFGGIGSYLVLQATSRRTLTSRRPSVLLALGGFWPAAAIGAGQGLLVAIVAQVAVSYDWGTWWAFAALCALVGVAFAAVNQALVAVLGGIGRWIAALIGVLAVAAGVVSTVPSALSAIASLVPTAPAYNAMIAVLTTAGGLGGAVAGLLAWTFIAFIATTLAVVRRRTTSAKAILAAV